jgi:hypothetical protein
MSQPKRNKPAGGEAIQVEKCGDQRDSHADTKPLFDGDYSTGDFSQWPTVQNVNYGGDAGSGYTPSYPLQLVSEAPCSYAARFEVRAGDIPAGQPSGERSEVGEASDTTLTPINSTRWYAFSVKFDPSFPTNHTELGWGVTNQWNSGVVASPTVFWGFQESPVGGPDGYWSLFQLPQSLPGAFLGQGLRLLDVRMDAGHWIDVKMQVHWSPSDADGYLRVWVNGVPQTLLTGGDTFRGRTTTPGDAYVHYHEGLYREAGILPTGILYHKGFRIADTESSL